jgi:hypothetical protein
MTDEYGRILRDLIPEKLARIDEDIERQLRDEPGSVDTSLPGFAKRMIGDRATRAARSSLNCDIFEVLAKGWCFAREMHRYTDPQKYPPDQETIVKLGEHTVATALHPVVTAMYAGQKLLSLRFTLELSGKFHASMLTIRNGRIICIGAGDCSVSLQLKYRSTRLHDPIESRTVKLDGVFFLPEPGLAIK